MRAQNAPPRGEVTGRPGSAARGATARLKRAPRREDAFLTVAVAACRTRRRSEQMRTNTLRFGPASTIASCDAAGRSGAASVGGRGAHHRDGAFGGSRSTPVANARRCGQMGGYTLPVGRIHTFFSDSRKFWSPRKKNQTTFSSESNSFFFSARGREAPPQKKAFPLNNVGTSWV